MNKKGIGIILVGLAAVLIAFSMLFLSRAVSIIDYGEVSIPGIGCDSCEFARQFLLNYSIIFGLTGGISGAVGIWSFFKGKKQGRINQRKAQEITSGHTSLFRRSWSLPPRIYVSP